MTEYIDQEAKDIASEVLATLEFVDSQTDEPMDYSGMVDEITRIISQELDAIRDERFEAGQEEAFDRGYEKGRGDEREDIAYEVRGQDRAWTMRVQEAGMDARSVVLPIIDWLDLGEDDVTLTMPEQEAYRLLAMVRAS